MPRFPKRIVDPAQPLELVSFKIKPAQKQHAYSHGNFSAYIRHLIDQDMAKAGKCAKATR